MPTHGNENYKTYYKVEHHGMNRDEISSFFCEAIAARGQSICRHIQARRHQGRQFEVNLEASGSGGPLAKQL